MTTMTSRYMLMFLEVEAAHSQIGHEKIKQVEIVVRNRIGHVFSSFLDKSTQN